MLASLFIDFTVKKVGVVVGNLRKTEFYDSYHSGNVGQIAFKGGILKIISHL